MMHPSVRKKCRILVPVLVLMLTLDGTVTAGALQNAETLDLTFGKGEQRVISLDNTQKNVQYYTQKYPTQKQAKAAAEKVSKQISDEGTVLLKNDGLLPLNAETVISPLGLGYFDPLYCGTGSSAISTLEEDVISPLEGLRQTFPHINEEIAAAQQSAYEAAAKTENEHLSATHPIDGSEQVLYEFKTEVIENVAASLKDTVGVIYLVRHAGENTDTHIGAYEDGTPHALAITQAECNLIALAKEHCRDVVVIISCASPMELASLEDDAGISAVLWQGGAGSTGYQSIADILSGLVNPSGCLPFTFSANFTKDATFANQDDGSDRFTYSNALTTRLTHIETEENAAAPFHEYEEGIYIGYRYYETAWAVGTLSEYYSRENGVVYPFGYGLSYTSFSQSIIGVESHHAQFVIRIRVINTGKVTGKQAVQLYVTAPYTDLDAEYAIEKPACALIAIGKTDLLQPGESEIVECTVGLEDLASYCYTHENEDGTTGCYMVENGDYLLTLRTDSHNVSDSCSLNISNDIWFADGFIRESERNAQNDLNEEETNAVSNADYMSAVNRFEQINTYMTSAEVSGAVCLTRADWENTQPSAPTDEDRTASETVIQWIQESDVFEVDTILPDAQQPVSGQQNDLTLASLRGISYDDPSWERLLNKLEYNQPEAYRTLLFEAAYQTEALSSIRKPRSSEKDGPQGLTLAGSDGKNWLSGVCGYPAAPVMAATWNRVLLYEYGAMVGQEALVQDINGWYAPGLNILRSPFCGRASEYYSEDPILAGLLGTEAVSGAGDNGLTCAVKHFCLMETEVHKGPNTCHWMTEQTLREIYLKPFEMAMKKARKSILCYADTDDSKMTLKFMRAGDFIMASDSSIGTEWTAASSALLTEVLRGEWGFQGTVVSDIHMNANTTMLRRMLVAGCDLLMSSTASRSVNFDSYDTAEGQALIRRAVKNLCYTLVNSGLMQGISPSAIIEYEISPWRKSLIVLNVSVLFISIILIIYMLIPSKKRKREQIY